MAGIINAEHINYFGKKSLDNLFFKHGFYSVNYNLFYSDLEHLNIIWSCYKKDTCIPHYLYKDQETKPSLSDFFDRQNRNMSNKLNQFSFNNDENAKAYIWGTGSYATQMLPEIKKYNIHILSFVDNNPKKIGKSIDNKEIISPDKLKDNLNLGDIIIICAMNFSTQIKEQIISMGIKNQIITI